MRLIKILTLLFFFTTYIYANDDIKQFDQDALNQQFNSVEVWIDKKRVSDYKKYLLKEKALVLLKMSYMGDDIAAVDEFILDDFLTLTMCLSYQFQDEADIEVSNLTEYVYDNMADRQQLVFSEIYKKMYSQEFLDVVLDYIMENSHNIIEVCTNLIN